MTTPSTFDRRWQQITLVWQRYLLEYRMLVIVALIVAGLWVFGSNGLSLLDDMLGYVTNVFTEALSIIVTVLVLDRLNERRADQRAEAALKEDLVRRAGGVANTFALDAVEELRRRGWLSGDASLLAGATLNGANLAAARLREANLSGVDLVAANLSNANLVGANLQGASLWRVNLRGAKVRYADCTDANLVGADMREVDLRNVTFAASTLVQANLAGAHCRDATFEGADLRKANLVGATWITSATFDERTLLPDAIPQTDRRGRTLRNADGQASYVAGSYWSPQTDMTRYTNPEHPQFWQPGWAALGFAGMVAWRDAGEPQPWHEAGYGDDHMGWVRDGKPGTAP